MAGLTVAVTGPTGDIGVATLRALDACDEVAEIRGMARRAFDPAKFGLSEKVSYRRGDVLDRPSVDEFIAGADVVVHLAFIIFGDPDVAHPINMRGSRNVFEAAVAAGAKRLVYTSSVAAYGFHTDNPQPLTEDVPTRGSEGFYYSAHKAELEEVLDEVISGTEIDAYLFRPCIVAGPDAITLVETMIRQLPVIGQIPMARRILGEVPFLAPVVPDPGIPVQLVHHDDVAQALVLATVGAGEPGAYNLAAPGELSVADLARSMGWWSVKIPGGVIGPLDDLLAKVPGMPAEVAWLATIRVPVAMSSEKAAVNLGWRPEHSAGRTLEATVASARAQDVI